MSRKTCIGVSLVVAVALAAVLGERWWHPRYDRIHFSGGGHYERAAVGDFVTAIRRKNLPELLRIGMGKQSYTDPEADETGAKWLLTNYSGRLDGAVGVSFDEPAVSSLELVACLSFDKGDTLRVTGLAEPDDRQYRISLADYPIDPKVALPSSGPCGSAP